MGFCSYCGTALDDASQYCPACGNRVSRPEYPAAQSQKQKRSLRPWPFIALGCVLLSIITAILKLSWAWPQLAIAGFVFGIIGARSRYKLNWIGIVCIPLAVGALLFGFFFSAARLVKSSLPGGKSYGFYIGPGDRQWDDSYDFGDSDEKWV